MNVKNVKYLLPAENINMGGLLIKQALPTQKIPHLDPFLLIHHADFKFNKNAPAKQQGVGPHPHRGFSPVTFVIKGEVYHRDSWGNSQIAKAGEVQWMNSGAGIIHSERPSQLIVEKEVNQEIVQLWINTPAEKKMNPPKYFHTSEKDIVRISNKDEVFENKLISGNYKGQVGKIPAESEVLVIWGKASIPGSTSFSISEKMNSMLYIISGELRIKGYGNVSKKNLVIFEKDYKKVILNTESDAEFLLLAGMPLDEKIVQQGPFVMNSTTEIMEAMRDYQMGKMGVLIEE